MGSINYHDLDKSYSSFNSQYSKTCCDSLIVEYTGTLKCKELDKSLGTLEYPSEKFSGCRLYKQNRICPFEKEKAEKEAAKEAERKAYYEREEKKAQVRKAAEQGDAQAQYELGQSYFTGWEKTQDYAKAAEWLGKAAAQGHTEAKDLLIKAKETAKEAAKKEAIKAIFPFALGAVIGGLLFLIFPEIIVDRYLNNFKGGGVALLIIILVIGDAWLASKLFDGCLSVIIGIIIGFIAGFVLCLLFYYISFIDIPSVYRLVSTVSGAVIGGLIGLLVKRIVET